MSKESHKEAGVSLLELSIVLPILLLLVAGVIDYGFALREYQVLNSASREGARIAASHPRLNPAAKCTSAVTSSSLRPCSEITGTNISNPEGGLERADSIVEVANKSACNMLLSSNFNPSDWDVFSEVPDPILEDGTSFQYVRVMLRKNDNAKNCLICWYSLLAGVIPVGESSFTLEAECQR